MFCKGYLKAPSVTLVQACQQVQSACTANLVSCEKALLLKGEECSCGNVTKVYERQKKKEGRLQPCLEKNVLLEPLTASRITIIIS